MVLSFRDKAHEDQILEFREIAEKISFLAGKYAVQITAYHDASLPIYSSLPLNKQAEALYSLKFFLRSLEETEVAGERLDDQCRSVWHALLSMGLMPPTDLFTKIMPDSLVEIYDLAGLQIWRNFNFMKHCSYTIEEIYSLEWFKRYKRDEAINADCIEKVGALLSGKSPEIYNPQVNEHVIEETCSVERLKFMAKYDFICRLKDREGQLMAWMVITSATTIGRGRELPRFSLVPPEQQHPSEGFFTTT